MGYLTGRQSGRTDPDQRGQFDESSGGAPLVPMVEATNFGDFDHASPTEVLDFAMLGAVHLKREMRAPVVIAVEGVAYHSPQMSLIQDDDVVEALPPDGSDHPFDEWIPDLLT